MESINYPLTYHRLKTRTVRVGNLKIGGDNPILIQSMLTSPTHDTERCLAEIRGLCLVGCRLIRLTVPSRKDLDSVPELRRLLKEEGLEVNLVADIHFSPQLAIDACEWFEKVRINPGNFSDSSKNAGHGLISASFSEGREKLNEALRPLVTNLKKYNRALRVGVNQGSLSSRMIERFGDTPVGMVESALETTRLLEASGFDQTVISLKSSNPLVVQKAYRLLMEKQSDSRRLPTHLGVTEAGNGEMARIKSLVGIGVLLRDGIGDTIRVSLAEPSVNEIGFAEKLIAAFPAEAGNQRVKNTHWTRPLDHQKMVTTELVINDRIRIGGGTPLKVGKLETGSLPKTTLSFSPDFTYQERHDVVCIVGGENQVLPVESAARLSEVNVSSAPAVLFRSDVPLSALRSFFRKWEANASQPPPVGIQYPWNDSVSLSDEIELAGVLSEGLIDFILVDGGITEDQFRRLLLFLQASRARIVTTDYIICPSCGRTLFDLQKTSEEIKAATTHLKGLKIGIMGCIVNGPGEMADADFGYVGSGPGKVDLYFGKTRVKRGVDENEAVSELLRLIEEKGYSKK